MICTTYFLTFFSELIPPTGIRLVLFIPPFIFIWSLNIKHFLIIRKIKSWKLWKSNKKSDSHEPDSPLSLNMSKKLIKNTINTHCKYKSYFSFRN